MLSRTFSHRQPSVSPITPRTPTIRTSLCPLTANNHPIPHQFPAPFTAVFAHFRQHRSSSSSTSPRWRSSTVLDSYVEKAARPISLRQVRYRSSFVVCCCRRYRYRGELPYLIGCSSYSLAAATSTTGASSTPPTMSAPNFQCVLHTAFEICKSFRT